MVIRNWRNVTPVVGHESKLIWSIFRAQSAEGREENEAVLLGFSGLTLHRLQGGLEGDYHEHEATEQVYYFLSGQGQGQIRSTGKYTKCARATQCTFRRGSSTSFPTLGTTGSST